MSSLTPESARRIHADSFVFDGHNDLAGPLDRGESLDDRDGRGHLDLTRMREGGLDGGIFALFIDPAEGDPLGRTLAGVHRLRATLDGHPAFQVVLSGADLVSAADEGSIAAVIGVEGGYAIDDDLAVVDEMFDAGVRCLTLTWNDPTAWADAAGNETHGGLTHFGRRLADRLQHIGVLVDLSHASDSTASDVLERAERPVVSSHAGMRRLAPLPRNVSDDHLEAIARTGGLTGVSLFNGHLDADFEAHCAPLRELEFADTEELARAVRAEVGTLPMSAVVDHVRHAAQVVGTEHVGLGSDFDGMWALPEGLEDVSRLPDLSAALADVFDADGLTAFLGANWVRVLRAALP
ncbi:MAG: dipeptidase [Gemmatimonadota bacterium]